MVAVLMVVTGVDSASSPATKNTPSLFFYLGALEINLTYWLPALNPLVTLVSVKSYRQFILNVVQHCMRKARIQPPIVAPTLAVVNSSKLDNKSNENLRRTLPDVVV
jgi:hypothetical protein